MFNKFSQANKTVSKGSKGFPCGTSGKEKKRKKKTTRQYMRQKRLRLDPESGRSPEGENGNPLQYSCLANPMDTGAWQATATGVAKSWIPLK